MTADAKFSALSNLEAQLVRLHTVLIILHDAKVKLQLTPGIAERELADLATSTVSLARAIERFARQAETMRTEAGR